MSTLSIRRPVFLRDTIYLSCLQPCLNSRRSLGRPSHDTVRRKRKRFLALHEYQPNDLTLHHLHPRYQTFSQCLQECWIIYLLGLCHKA